MDRRRAEDPEALDLLGARAHWLPPSTTGPLPASAIVEGLQAALVACRPGTVALPLGLFHDDHTTTHEAGLRVAQAVPSLQWLLYADALYRTLPGLVQARLDELATGGWRTAPLPAGSGRHLALKQRAVACYASQLRALATARPDGVADAFELEQYWCLAR